MVIWSDCTIATVTGCAPFFLGLIYVLEIALYLTYLAYMPLYYLVPACCLVSLLVCLFAMHLVYPAYFLYICSFLVFSMSFVSVDHAGYSVNMSLK